MDKIQLLIDLHKDGLRQGPGSTASTKKALEMTGLDLSSQLKVADIGCGTGASTLVLAESMSAKIIAIDFLQEFLDILVSRSSERGLEKFISTKTCSMDNLPFSENELDLIWSEGAIYNIGFKKGIADWRKYIKPGGVLVASDITWLTDERPEELQNHWDHEYPEIGNASAKMRVIEQSGYSPLGYFVLPKACWTDEYYNPMTGRFPAFLSKFQHSKEAIEVVDAEKYEIALYEKYSKYVSYGVYIARRL